MPLCATYNAAHQVEIVVPQPADISNCALLIPTAGDSINSPFALSSSDGLAIAYAIVAVWVVGFGTRAIIRVLKS
jgi:uncharacterized protein (UPF0210 family)